MFLAEHQKSCLVLLLWLQQYDIKLKRWREAYENVVHKCRCYASV